MYNERVIYIGTLAHTLCSLRFEVFGCYNYVIYAFVKAECEFS